VAIRARGREAYLPSVFRLAPPHQPGNSRPCTRGSASPDPHSPDLLIVQDTSAPTGFTWRPVGTEDRGKCRQSPGARRIHARRASGPVGRMTHRALARGSPLTRRTIPGYLPERGLSAGQAPGYAELSRSRPATGLRIPRPIMIVIVTFAFLAAPLAAKAELPGKVFRRRVTPPRGAPAATARGPA